jgi:23S rRNA pseudouridine1911/1915/1917 synthase
MSTVQPREDYNPDETGEPERIVVPRGCAGQRLDRALVRLLPRYSRNRLARWIRAGRVTVDGAPALPRRVVHEGAVVVVRPDPHPAASAHRAEAIPLDIVFEDDALIVVNKPPGLVVHPGSGNWRGTLLNALLAHDPALSGLPRAGIVHRLDKDTSGLLVVAKTLPAQAELARQLHARSVRREYLALARGRVARDGRIDAPVGRHPVARTRMAVTARGRRAVTHYQVLERFAAATLLRCRLETGRTHQIRVHLRALGHPIVGDALYGGRGDGIAFPRQALHAERLELLHPVTRKTVAWQADPPGDMRDLISALRREATESPPSRGTVHGPRRRK